LEKSLGVNATGGSYGLAALAKDPDNATYPSKINGNMQRAQMLAAKASIEERVRPSAQ